MQRIVEIMPPAPESDTVGIVASPTDQVLPAIAPSAEVEVFVKKPNQKDQSAMSRRMYEMGGHGTISTFSDENLLDDIAEDQDQDEGGNDVPIRQRVTLNTAGERMSIEIDEEDVVDAEAIMRSPLIQEIGGGGGGGIPVLEDATDKVQELRKQRERIMEQLSSLPATNSTSLSSSKPTRCVIEELDDDDVVEGDEIETINAHSFDIKQVQDGWTAEPSISSLSSSMPTITEEEVDGELEGVDKKSRVEKGTVLSQMDEELMKLEAQLSTLDPTVDM